MEKIRLRARRFFTGLRRLLPHIPGFVWIAITHTTKSTRTYWKRSQRLVERIADEYMREAMAEEKTTEYNFSLYQTCYAIAAFMYLLGWLMQAWLTVEAFRLVASLIF